MADYFIKAGASGTGNSYGDEADPSLLETVPAGSTVYVIGEVGTLQPASMNGASGNRITIRGDYVSESGSVKSGLDVSSTGDWTNVSGNYWKCNTLSDFSTARFGSWLMLGTPAQGNVSRVINDPSPDTDTTDYTDMTTQGECWFDRATDEYYVYSVGNPGTFYAEITMPYYDYPIWLDGIDHVDIRNIDCSFSAVGGIRITDCNYVTVDSCTGIWIGGGIARPLGATSPIAGDGWGIDGECSYIDMTNNTIEQAYDIGMSVQTYAPGPEVSFHTHHITFSGNTVDRCPMGIACAAHSGTMTMDDILITTNTVTNSGYGWAGYTDNAVHGVGIGMKENDESRVIATFEYNRVSNSAWCGFRSFEGYFIVRYNEFIDTQGDYTAEPFLKAAGIALFGGSIGPEDDSENNKCRGLVYGNLVAGGNSRGIYIFHNQPGYTGTLTDPTWGEVSVYNNTFVNNELGCLESSGSDNTKFYNNVLSQTGTDVFIDTDTTTNAYVGDNNCFYNPTSPEWIWQNTSYTTFSSFKTASSTDGSSIDSNPTLHTNHRPLTGSPLFDNGVSTYLPTDGLEGVPHTDPPAIGAYASAHVLNAHYVSQNGAGFKDGTDPANAWDHASMDWLAVQDDTVYILDTVRGWPSGVRGGSAGTTVIRGDFPNRPGIIDGAGIDTTLLGFSVPGQHDVNITYLTFTNVAPGATNRAIFLNNANDVNINWCTFQDTELAQGVYVYCPPTSNTSADITIALNTFRNWTDRDYSSSEGCAIFISADNTDDTALANVDIIANNCEDSNMFFRSLMTNEATISNKYMPTGLTIQFNSITRCERAIQQVRWTDGSGVSPSFVRSNILTDIGTSGPAGTGTTLSNMIQLEACDGGDVSLNTVDGWEKEDAGGDGCGVILDWYNSDEDYFCDSVDVFRNTFRNGAQEQVYEYAWCPAINLYRAKNCDVYSNLIYNCRTAFVAAGNGVIPANSQGNRVYNNTAYNMTYEGIRLNDDAEVVIFQNNVFVHCESLYSAHGSAAAPTWDYNAYYACGGSPPSVGGNDVTDDPLLGRYHPRTGTPLDGAGVATFAGIDDYDGNTQPNPPFIGAYATEESTIEIDMDDTILDGMQEDGTPTVITGQNTAIRVKDCSRVIIRNFVFDSCRYGVFLDGTTRHVIIEHCDMICVYDSQPLSTWLVKAENTDDAENVRIQHCSAIGGAGLVSLVNTDHVSVRYCRCVGGNTMGMNIRGAYFSIVGNTIEDCGAEGIRVQTRIDAGFSGYGVIQDNLIQNHGGVVTPSWGGIRSEPQRCVITNNEVRFNHEGAYLTTSGFSVGGSGSRLQGNRAITADTWGTRSGYTYYGGAASNRTEILNEESIE